VTFEYVLLEGVNDDKKHALELGKKIAGTKMKVNVIPFNRVERSRTGRRRRRRSTGS
jgi:23S rRNA (adenine2503-C2)-methyltransferase